MAQLHNGLPTMSTGSTFSVDRIMHSFSSNPSVIDRYRSACLIHYDAAGYMILDTDDSGPCRLIFAEDLLNPDFTIMSKSTFVSKITEACRYDSLMKSIFSNGIPISNEIFFPNIKSELNDTEILDIINYHAVCDHPERNSIELVLSNNGVYKLPLLAGFYEHYSTTLNGLKPTGNITIIEDGWYHYGKVIKKQLIAA